MKLSKIIKHRQRFEVIVTLNTALNKTCRLADFLASGATIFRINGSHVSAMDLSGFVEKIRKSLTNKAKILLDLPGNKIRVKGLKKPLQVRKGKLFKLDKDHFNFPKFFNFLNKNQLLIANDGMLQLRLLDVNGHKATFEPLNDGSIPDGKGIIIYGSSPNFPFLTATDCDLIDAAVTAQIDYIGFSYVRTRENVLEALELIKGTKVKAIFKIETAEALHRLKEILPLVNRILVDRGDLSSEIGIYQVPGALDTIIKTAKQFHKKIYLATQFLHYMIDHPIPSISEVVALCDVLLVVDGIQLSEETAVGKYPLRAVEVIRELLNLTGRK